MPSAIRSSAATSRRSQAVEKQRQLMQAWADYLEGVEAKVVPLKRA